MSRGILSPFFPATQRDVSRLRQTATDAVNDFSTTAATHAGKVRHRLRDLAGHLHDEGRDNLGRAQSGFLNALAAVRDVARDRPVTCLAAVLGLGVLIGFTFRGSPGHKRID